MTPKRPAIIDVVIKSAAWRKALPSAAALARRATDAALKSQRSRRAVEIAVIFTSDAAVRRLNAHYRGKDKPTNVLSFPASDGSPAGGGKGQPLLLGDVVLAYGTVAREAKESSKPLKNHVSHLIVHGVLHLLGYDHERTADAAAMEKLETRILAALGIADPYGAPAPTRPPALTPRKSRR